MGPNSREGLYIESWFYYIPQRFAFATTTNYLLSNSASITFNNVNFSIWNKIDSQRFKYHETEINSRVQIYFIFFK